jgi:hypothetical protein
MKTTVRQGVSDSFGRVRRPNIGDLHDNRDFDQQPEGPKAAENMTSARARRRSGQFSRFFGSLGDLGGADGGCAPGDDLAPGWRVVRGQDRGLPRLLLSSMPRLLSSLSSFFARACGPRRPLRGHLTDSSASRRQLYYWTAI